MKVNAKTTRYMMVINAIYFIATIVALLFALNQSRPPFYFTLFRELLFDTQLIYLVYVLKHLYEKKSYINTLIAFIIFNFTITFLSGVTATNTNGDWLLFLLSVFIMLMSIILIIQFFKLRNTELRLPYGLFGLAYLTYMLFYVTAGALIILAGQTVVQIIMFCLLFTPASLCYALIGITRYLKTQDELNRSISEFRIQ
ncbi:hypothetical protein [Mucilaginibacter dorajii]|uniref:Uncharacterized protein n=1 Tax=Mucilaginibacter dorajii TaxID=692994 RepID=A0ABP7QJX7_9SPHI|nr:hypothetical protein [Mucilaginibacter dorajii]MCS3734127.1 putative neutral ceramidase superfamily lipid hydrolase [Mucilaginibacter dorajii]